MKAMDVKDNTYIDFGKEVNDKDPKFPGAKGCTPNSSEEVFVTKKLKNTVP